MEWKELLPYLGVPGVMLLGALYSLHKGWFVTKRESDKQDVMWQKRLEDCNDTWKARYQEMNKVWSVQDQRMEQTASFWRDIALPLMHIARKATQTSKDATTALAEVVRKDGPS